MIGKVLQTNDKMFSDDRLTLVYKHLVKGEDIPSHNHENCNIFLI